MTTYGETIFNFYKLVIDLSSDDTSQLKDFNHFKELLKKHWLKALGLGGTTEQPYIYALPILKHESKIVYIRTLLYLPSLSNHSSRNFQAI